MSGKKNRIDGHNWEREVRKYIRDTYNLDDKDIHTSRYSSKRLDDNKVDIDDNTPFAFQCKVISTKALDLLKVMKEMETSDIKVVLVKQREKKDTKAGTRFYTRGKLAVLYLEDYLDLIYQLHQYQMKEANEQHLSKDQVSL